MGTSALGAILLALFFPRFGETLDGCSSQGKDSVWIAPPETAEVVARCREAYPAFTVPDNPPMIVEKVFEEVDRCCFCNFHGRRYLHRVRYRCEVFPAGQVPGQTLVVLIDYDHYHLNGGGCLTR